MTSFMECAPGINLTEEDVKKYMQSGFFVLEQKLDGVRLRISCNKGMVTMETRNLTFHGGVLPDVLFSVSPIIGQDWIAEGELCSTRGFAHVQQIMGQVSQNKYGQSQDLFWTPFDVTMAPGRSQPVTNENYITRREILMDMFDLKTSKVSPVKSQHIHSDYMGWYGALKSKGQEGVVLKRLQDPYNSLNTASWFKSKFIQTISVIPKYIDANDVVHFSVFNGNDQDIEVGSCRVPSSGDLYLIVDAIMNNRELVMEIESPGLSEKGQLRHPTYKGLRYDNGFGACTIQQLDSLRNF